MRFIWGAVRSAALAAGGALVGAVAAGRIVNALDRLKDSDAASLGQQIFEHLARLAWRDIPSTDLDVCKECGEGFAACFMLTNDMWWAVLTEEERRLQFAGDAYHPLLPGEPGQASVKLCLRCCATRLGTPLPADALDPECRTTSTLLQAVRWVVVEVDDQEAHAEGDV